MIATATIAAMMNNLPAGFNLIVILFMFCWFENLIFLVLFGHGLGTRRQSLNFASVASHTYAVNNSIGLVLQAKTTVEKERSIFVSPRLPGEWLFQ